jgi:hypothetical protein
MKKILILFVITISFYTVTEVFWMQEPAFFTWHLPVVFISGGVAGVCFWAIWEKI